MIAVTKDVIGSDYAALLATACERYPQFSLVWREQLTFDPTARSIQQELRRFQLGRSHTSTWPGTRLVGARAEVIRYSIDAVRTGVLLRSGSLFGWRSPKLREDLSFYTTDGTWSIVTVSHEQEAWFFKDDWLCLLPVCSGATLEQPSDEAIQLL